ncbi:hypothetical protein EMCRGX_G005103 [Ephydatia muelleri]
MLSAVKVQWVLLLTCCFCCDAATRESIALASGLKADMMLLGHLSTLDVNQLYSNVNNFKPLYQKLLNVLVSSRKMKEMFQSGLGDEVLSSVLGKLEADMCSWFRYVINKPGLNETTAPFNRTQEILIMQQRSTTILSSMSSLYDRLPDSNNQQNPQDWLQSNFQSTNSSAIRNIIKIVYPTVRI